MRSERLKSAGAISFTRAVTINRAFVVGPDFRLSIRRTSLVRGRFTLIELLVVIAIIAILASLLLPALKKSKQMAVSAACMNRQREVGMAFRYFASDHDNWFPPRSTRSGSHPCGSIYDQIESGSKTGWWSWHDFVYMYLNDAYAQAANDAGYPGFHALREGTINVTPERPWRFTPTVRRSSNPPFYADGSVLSCPAAPDSVHIAQDFLPIRFGLPQYQIEDPCRNLPRLHTDVIGGASKTVLIMDAGVDPDDGRTSYGTVDRYPGGPQQAVWYAKPGWQHGSYVTRRHMGGCNQLFLDGHVEHVRDSDSPSSPIFVDIENSVHRWSDTWY